MLTLEQLVEKEQQIVVPSKEIERCERELEATAKRQADAERYRVETEASAQRTKSEQVALGESEATRRKGIAEADVIKATGTSEAEIMALKGGAEAEAMRKKADSFKQYNEAAVLQILLAALPEIAKAVAEPLSKTDRITLVSTGGDGTGASKLTGDIAKIMAELPAVVESLSGVDIRRLIDAIPGLQAAGGEAPEKPARSGGSSKAEKKSDAPRS